MAGNLLDRAIGFFNPRAGAARLSYRRKMEILDGVAARSLGYEGAAKGRLSQGWSGGGGDANIFNKISGQDLRNNSRKLDRDNELARNILSTHADYLVGPCITPRAVVKEDDKDRSRAKAVNELFDKWSKVAFVDGQDFYSGIYQSARMMCADGEDYIRRRTRRPSDGLPVPLQLQILDAEYCDWNKHGQVDGRKVIDGIAFDNIGRRVGYWMFPQNPNARTLDLSVSTSSSFIPETEIAHLYESTSNQVHGVPWLAPVIVALNNLSDYEFAENIRKKSEACTVGVIIPGDPDYDPNGGEAGEPDNKAAQIGVKDADGRPYSRMEPGTFVVAHGGKDVKFNTPAAAVGMEGYVRTRHRAIAAGARIPYELMTGDFAQGNFSLSKLGLLKYKRFVEHIQWHFIIPQACQRVWDWFIDAAVLAGKLPLSWEIGVEWTPPPLEHSDRLEEAKADFFEVRMGAMSPQEMITKRGRIPEVVLTEFNEWFAKVDKLPTKLVFDIDPRALSQNGQSQNAGAAQTGDPNVQKGT